MAAARGDVFFEIGFGGPWDVAAGALILTEAGGVVIDPAGESVHCIPSRCVLPLIWLAIPVALCCTHKLVVSQEHGDLTCLCEILTKS